MVFYPIKSSPGLTESQLLEKLQQSTVLVPAVSFANVPQLAVDLLVNNLGAVKVGRLDDRFLYPFVSAIDFAVTGSGSHPPTVQPPTAHDISTALEVYYSASHNLTILQQRSPVLPQFALPFITEVLVPFVTEVGRFKEAVVLSSADITNTIDDKPGDRVAVHCSLDVLEKFKLLRISEEGKEGAAKLSTEESGPSAAQYQDVSQISDMFTKVLYNKITQSFANLGAAHASPRVLPIVSALSIYVFEGDNFQDAVYFYDRIVRFLGVKGKGVGAGHALVTPFSWLGFYGDKPVPVSMEEGIFG